jgi:hypothetical protein
LPKYVYKCSECERIYELIHSFGEQVLYCSEANEDSKCSGTSTLERVPQIVNYIDNKPSGKQKVGQIVDEYIKNTKQDIKEYKKELKTGWSDKT